MHRRRDLAAIVQQAGDLELVPVLLRHGEVGQRSVLGLVDRFGQHHRQGRYALAVAAGIRRLVIDRAIDQTNQRFKQIFQLIQKIAIGQSDCGL